MRFDFRLIFFLNIVAFLILYINFYCKYVSNNHLYANELSQIHFDNGKIAR